MIGKFKATFFILILLFVVFSSFAQPPTLLQTGDSLFRAQKYTNAFESYQQLFSDGQATEAMLLKMAFIKEGLGDYVQALYFLNQFYKVSADKSVLYKMEELAEKNQLVGYEMADRDFFLNSLRKYSIQIQLGLIGASIFLLVFTYQSKKKKNLPFGVLVFQVIILVTLLMLSNDWLDKNLAIVNEGTMIMNGPSAASEPIEQLKKGHQVEIIGTSEVWTRIIWNDREAYIRNSKITGLE